MPSNINSKVVTQGLHRLDGAGFDRLLAEAPPATQVTGKPSGVRLPLVFRS